MLPAFEIGERVKVFWIAASADAEIVTFPGDTVAVEQVGNGGPVQTTTPNSIDGFATRRS
jgi:hypothetical protein